MIQKDYHTFVLLTKILHKINLGKILYNVGQNIDNCAVMKPMCKNAMELSRLTV